MIIETIRKRILEKEEEGLVISKEIVEEILNEIEDEINGEFI